MNRQSPSPPVIGLVGGIGSGKSTVARMLRELGCVVADSDDFARQALRDPSIKKQIVEWWGHAVLDSSSGEIDRSRIAKIVFADPAQRKRLESLTHPWIEQRRRELFHAAPAATKALVIDAPLLLEAGLQRECDAVIFIEAPPEIRSHRVRTSRGWSENQWQSREAAQMPLDEKRRRADHTVVNSGDLHELRAAVARTLETIVTRPSPKQTRQTRAK